MSTLFYRNFRLLLLTIILIFVWGFSAYQTLPRMEDPELVSRNAIVKTFLPGASAERVESLVTDKIEQELSEIEEIKNYTSTSRTGSSIIQIELLGRVKHEEVDGIWSRVRDAIDDARVELPPETTEPEFEELEVKAYGLIAALTWEQSEPPNYAILNRQAESLEDELQGLAGTEKVEIFGAPDEEIVVTINPTDLATLNLTAQELSQQIQQSDAKVAAGQLRSSSNDLLIELEAELDSLERIRNIPIHFGSEGQFVHLGDIALVKKGIAEPPTELALIDGRPAVAIASFVESGVRLDHWEKRTQQTLDKFRQQLPTGLELQVIFNQSEYVENRLNNLTFNLLLGVLLVFGVTLLMMGWRSALIVGTTLPLSILMVFGFMGLMGIPLHQMSVTGIIVALGLLIDTAIVVVDEVNHNLGRGMKPKAAISKSVDYLKIPLLSSTLTTALAFMPIVLMPGMDGEFVGTIGISVIVAVFSSLFLALTIIPALAARLHRPRKPGIKVVNHQSSWWQTGFSSSKLTQFYRWILNLVLARPVIGVILAIILPLVGFVQAANLEEQFFPAADRDQFQIELELTSSASVEQTRMIVEQARTMILEHPEVANVHWFIGQNAPRFYYNLTGGREQEANYAQALVQLRSIADPTLIQKIQTELDVALPDAQMLVRPLEQGPPFEAPVEMRIYGSDLESLQELGEEARVLLAQVDQVTHTRDSLSQILPQLKLKVDEEEARLVGLNHTSIAQQLNNTLEGNVGGSILESTEELPVRVRLSNLRRSDLAQISSLDLLPSLPSSSSSNTPSANTIPLSALGEVGLAPEQAKITRRNGQRVNIVQGFIAAGALPAKVLAQFQQQLNSNELQLPTGYWLQFGGEAEKRDDAVGGLAASVGVLMVLMVATLVLSLNSFRLAGMIGIVAFCSFGLGLFSLWLFGYPLGFMAMIGIIGLVGVAINDSIVVLVALRENPSARTGNRKAVCSVVTQATRHIITTTLTTMIGFVPLILDSGGFWPPLAVAIAGGIAGATLLALFFVPCTYLLLARLSCMK